jgi:prepilin-type N-terminal cleavage/methylation domain-containing protein
MHLESMIRFVRAAAAPRRGDRRTRARVAPRGTARDARGFSLIELMIALVISSIVVLGIFAFASIQTANADQFQRNVKVAQSLEGGMWAVGKDVRAAGLGFARHCSELRVWDGLDSRFVNPGNRQGSADDPLRDAVTGEPYWVLRDGLQGHWDAETADVLEDRGFNPSMSASPRSAADSFDVVLGDSTRVFGPDVFEISGPLSAAIGARAIDVAFSPAIAGQLSTDTPEHLLQLQQLFAPGTFVAIGGPRSGLPWNQGQCALVQVTGDAFDIGAGNVVRVPIGLESGFNRELGRLFGEPTNAGGVTLWDPAFHDNPGSTFVIPLGRLRWSRYEIDYGDVAPGSSPMLVRSDLIGVQPGDPAGLGNGTLYPECDATGCRAAQLHLPGSNAPPLAVGIAPGIADMQVAIGCDGYDPIAPPPDGGPPPQAGMGEIGALGGPTAGLTNYRVDEGIDDGTRGRDEWLGNSPDETFNPDCVRGGFAEEEPRWATVYTAFPYPQNSTPQLFRISLVGGSDTPSPAGGLSTVQLPPLENRLPVQPRFSLPDGREWRVMTQVFQPRNIPYRNGEYR